MSKSLFALSWVAMLKMAITAHQYYTRQEVLGHFDRENYAWGLGIVKKLLWISNHFDTENYTWRLDIV